MTQELMLGAVAYDQKVVPIWEGIREYFPGAPVEMDVVLFLNYEAQVERAPGGEDRHRLEHQPGVRPDAPRDHGACRVLAMRDTDVAFCTMLVGRAGRSSAVEDIRGRTARAGQRRLGAGGDHAAPLPDPTGAGVRATTSTLLRFNTDVGKHGDTGRSEREALAAVLDGRADVAAVGAASWDVFVRTGEVPPGELAPFWTSPPYSHCNFTAMTVAGRRGRGRMGRAPPHDDVDDPEHRRILELEGLHEWLGPNLDGYADVFAAVEEQGIDGSMVNEKRSAVASRRLDTTGELSIWRAGSCSRSTCACPTSRPGSSWSCRAPTPGSLTSCRAWCRGTGHELVASEPDGDRALYRIRRGHRAALMFKD